MEEKMNDPFDQDKLGQKGKHDKSSISHKVGDAIERVGEKLKDAGATKLGQKVYDVGNRIEHSKDDVRKH